MVAIDTTQINKIARSTRQVIFPKEADNNDHLVPNIKRYLAVAILYTNSSVAYGYIKWNSRAQVPEIIVSRKLPWEMQTFTIAHELGHLFLHWGWAPGTDLSAKATKQYDILDAYHSSAMDARHLSSIDVGQEKEADAFAQALLMPAPALRKLIQGSKVKDPDYLKYVVSHDFHVTIDTACLRLRRLNQ